MPRLYLVRHGEPSVTWSDSSDPGLSPLGHEQAKAVADRLGTFGALDIVTSPLRRAQETAAPFALLRHATTTIAAAVSEIPTPPGVPLDKRGDWLRAVMTGAWREADVPLQAWRKKVIEFLQDLPNNTAIFSHYVAINVAVAAARRDDSVTVFAPAHTSITTLDATPTGLIEDELGRTGQTAVR